MFFYNRMRYLIGVKIGITYVISHNYEKIKVDSSESLPLEKTLSLHNNIIFIIWVFNKDKNNHYYNIFLWYGSYKLPKTVIINKLYKL